jgi:biotin operon repressor
MSNHENEEMLTGGNVSNVYRSGDTVRRELKPDSTKIHKAIKAFREQRFQLCTKVFGY